MKKKVIILLLVFCIGLTFAQTAFADGSSVLTVNDLKGNVTVSPGTGFTESDLFSSFKNLIPGDEKTENIQVLNKCRECDAVRVFLETIPHNSTDNPLSPNVAEKETISSMEDFLSQLTLKIWVRDVQVFSGKANEALKSPVPLGLIPKNDSADIRVTVEVPKELGNEYADRIGEIDWKFTFEDNGGSQSGKNLTVRKLWSDGNDKHKGQHVTVYLKKDGEPWQSAVLDASNQWCYCFENLSNSSKWTVDEITETEGYNAQYKREGQLITIKNVSEGTEPETPNDPVFNKNISVHKLWAAPDKPHPDYVECTLYCDDAAFDTVRLSAENDWSYSWSGLDETKNWQVIESYCEDSYVPSYKADDEGRVSITNTAFLIQTGQLKWPVPVLAVLGLLLITTGLVMRKRREE